jgi:hypothetical protein
LDFSLLTNYWLDEFLVVLVAGALLLGVELWLESRKRAEIEITKAESGDRLGFEIKVKKKTLNHPRIYFYAGWARPERGFDFQPCDLYDKDGNNYKDDFILVGRPIRIFPMLTEKAFRDEGEAIKISITVIDAATKREILSLPVPSLPKATNLGVTYPREPKVDPYKQVSIQITGEGLEKDSLQRFRLGLEAIIFMQYPLPSPEAVHVFPRLLIQREPWIMRRL